MKNNHLCIIGLGYVGLPLGVEFAKKYEVVGFDINSQRIKELRNHHDKTLEISDEELKKTSMIFTSSVEDIRKCNVFIITVPTPVTQNKQPDLRPIKSATRLVASVLKKDDIVIYESTVYPGCTEEDCVPILEEVSKLKFNRDFFCGYSPERINPGDKTHKVTSIVKITSGSTPAAAEKINKLYSTIITAGTYLAPSIKVAEAAKVIENTQRDINIAFVNELSLIFNKLGLDTKEILKAASTKWNFLNFTPGLVGGHCIGVDPYYLTYKAESIGYHPQVILSGRRINDGMGSYVANQVIKLIIKKGHQVQGSKILILGLTFKENCPDIRNSKVFDIVDELKEFGCHVELFDPWVDTQDLMEEHKMEMTNKDCLKNLKSYEAVILAVSHGNFQDLDIHHLKSTKTVFYDLKGMFEAEKSDGRL
jgi:UDP-N-acetyl-D-galactosamine dehydrogenase